MRDMILKRQGESKKRPLLIKMHVVGIWYDEIVAGRKTVEGRRGEYSKHSSLIGKNVVIYRNIGEAVSVRVLSVKHYDTLEEYILNEDVREYAPHLNGDRSAAYLAYCQVYLNYARMMCHDSSRNISVEDYIKRSGGINAIKIKLN
jgi:ASC-1-like (ASCH) protein